MNFRKESLLVKVGTGLLGTLSLIGTIQGLTTDRKFSFTELMYLTVILSSIVLCYFVIRAYQNHRIIAAEEIFLFGLRDTKKAKILFPCEDKHYRLANKLAKGAFGKKDSMSYQTVDMWRKKNPYILSLFLDANRKVAGYFDVFPLQDEFEKKLAVGDFDEHDIDAAAMCSPDRMFLCKTIYIGGIAVLNPDTYEGRKNGALIIRSLLEYIKHFYDVNKEIKVSATAVTKCGRMILERMGFEIEVDSSIRKDNHDYYSRYITKADLNEIMGTIGRLDKYIDLTDYTRFKKELLQQN